VKGPEKAQRDHADSEELILSHAMAS
jgi:hypothetical protein